MPRAGFYAVESGKISFRRDGNWYTDEERIDNPRIALLFSRSIGRNPDGSYFLQIGDERASITVEDTPYVVKSVEGDGEKGFTLVLNDDSREPLEANSLEVGADNVLYCTVKNGRWRARFLRPAYYHLSNSLGVDEQGDFFFTVAGKRYPVGRSSADTSAK